MYFQQFWGLYNHQNDHWSPLQNSSKWVPNSFYIDTSDNNLMIWYMIVQQSLTCFCNSTFSLSYYYLTKRFEYPLLKKLQSYMLFFVFFSWLFRLTDSSISKTAPILRINRLLNTDICSFIPRTFWSYQVISDCHFRGKIK